MRSVCALIWERSVCALILCFLHTPVMDDKCKLEVTQNVKCRIPGFKLFQK